MVSEVMSLFCRVPPVLGRGWFPPVLLAIGLLLLVSCAINPVTGEKELTMVSESMELEVGQKQYAPSRQMQGGDYRMDSELTRYVRRVGERLAAVSDRRLPYEFVVINDSSPNAWALPGGKIAINRGLLLELDSEAGLAAVLSHEIVHAAARHGAKGMERGLLLQGALLATRITTQDRSYSRMAVGAAAIGANLLNQSYSRNAEREADDYGMIYMVRAGYDPHAAVALQETFVRLSKESRQDWLSGLFASHPPSQERVERNRATAQRLAGGNLILGKARYRRMTAGLREDRAAYEAYDKGHRALKEGDTKRAMALAERALGMESGEALFYGLRGDARFRMKRYQLALSDYNRALDRDPGFFRYYLQRARVLQIQGDRRGARSDLKRSAALLPTSNAYYELGRLALAGGDHSQAKGYFHKASGSTSDSGKAALRELVRLDLPDNPTQYLKTRLTLGKGGRLLVSIRNGTPLTVGNVRVVVGQVDGRGGFHGVERVRLRGVIPAGKTVRLETSIAGMESVKAAQSYRVRLEGAEVMER